MSGKTAGQQACETFWAAVRRRNGGEDAGDWPGNAWEWAGETGARDSWEAAAAAVETGQLRLAREDRDQLRKQVLDLAADLDISAAVTMPSKKSTIEDELAIALRKIAEPPS